jgi:predicted DNA-binding transcriptional regulator YafY
MKELQILQLIQYIETNGSASGQRCADIIGISLSTLKRDLKKLDSEFRQNGFSISGKTGHGNGYVCEISNPGLFEK